MSVFSHFKNVMTYFNEPLLDSASIDNLFFLDDKTLKTFKGAKFEGVRGTKMAEFLHDEIVAVSKEATSYDPKTKQELLDFGKNLENGIKIMTDLSSISTFPVDTTNELIEKALEIQKNLLLNLEITQKLVIPYAWFGSDPHAIGIIIEKQAENENENDHYNLIIVNSGDGVDYHYGQVDPKNVHLSLKRLWIEFKNIPEAEIFDEKAWFIQSLIRLRIEESVVVIQGASGSIPNYFYGSILPNFRNYLEKPDKSLNKWIPYQRSGSCTLSSLMASYLYYAKEDLSFHYNRILLGHKILNNFLDSVVKNQKDKDFEKLITDGFDLISRKLLKSTSSALAYQILIYLEFKIPSVFKNAGLLGEGRTSWFRDKKTEAIDALKSDTETFKLIQKSVGLALKIHKILIENPINKDTNNIVIDEELRSLNPQRYTHNESYLDFNQTTAGDFYEFLKEPIKRSPKKHKTIGEIYTALKICLKTNELTFNTCILDVFRNSEKKDWWNLFCTEPLKFLKVCEDITRAYIKSGATPTSFDDMIMLMHVQIGAWKFALEYDQKQDVMGISHLGLDKFLPPLVIQSALSKDLNKKNDSITSGIFKNWAIRTSFYASNLDELAYLLEEYLKFKTSDEDKERFLGPNDFLTVQDEKIWNYSTAFNKITANKMSKVMYEKMCNEDDKIKKILDQLKAENALNTKNTKWGKVDYANYALIISRQELFFNNFPHFYHLMNSFIWIYQGIVMRPRTGSETTNHSLGPNSNNLEGASLSLKELNKDHEHVNLHTGQTHFSFESIDTCTNLKVTLVEDSIFYILRHSQALGTTNTELSFNSWLNYLKSAPDSTIFDDPYYSYLADRMLNMPNVELTNTYNIDLSVKTTYPLGFKDFHIREIFNAVLKLINIDLNYIIEKQGQLEIAEMSKLVKRSVNVCIPLVRFLARIDYDQIISADSVASMLAKLYMTFYKFSPLKSTTGLGDSEISTVNLVLTQICDVPIRNSKSFLAKLTLDLDSKNQSRTKVVMFRRSLARVHWFLTKIFFTTTAIGRSHADDLNNIGFVYYPIEFNEAPFTESLLRKLFLVSHMNAIPDADWSKSFGFFNDGDIVKMESTSNYSKTTLIAVQLSSGKVVKNGSLQVEKQFLLNNADFQEYFRNNLIPASNGEITKIGVALVYILKDYKFIGNNIIVLSKQSKCEFYRKYHGEWYKWVSNEIDALQNGLKYLWTLKYKIYVNSESGKTKTNFVLLTDEKEEPLFTAINKFQSTEIFIKGKGHALKVINYDPKNKPEHESFLERHFQKFTDSDTIVASYAETKLNVAIIYPGLRLAQDPDQPLTLLEIENTADPNESIFQIVNLPGAIVEHEQVASQDIGIVGTLTIKNKDGQRFIMAPFKSIGTETDRKNVILVELIPIVSGLPAPQTRLQRILLAYFSIYAHNFVLARELLHPFISLNQNEVFSNKELQVMNWIVKIKKRGPEGNALILMVFAHIVINKAKFPLEYVAELKTTSPEGVLRHERQVSFDEIKKSFLESIIKYIYSIRDLSEKFYVFRIFPELLDSNMFPELKSISAKKEMPAEPKKNSPDFKCYNNKDCRENLAKATLKPIGEISSENISDFFKIIAENDSDNADLKNYLKQMSKFLHRQKGGAMTSRQSEMIIYCAAKNIKPWIPIAKDVLKYCDTDDKSKNKENDDILTKIFKETNKQFDICHKAYSEEFKPVNSFVDSEEMNVDLIVISLQSDIKSNFSNERDFTPIEFELVTYEDLKQNTEISIKLNRILKIDKISPMGFDFDQSNLEQSDVLKKLKKSIQSFIEKNGQYVEIEIDLKHRNLDINQALVTFKKFVEGRISTILKKLNELTIELIFKVSEEQFNANETRTIEALSRLMHQRKLKKFENLYACYQRQSSSCMQSKFPHFTLEECQELLNSTMKFYSHQVFLDFLKMQLKTVEKFIQNKVIMVDDLAIFLDELEKLKNFNSRLKSPVVLNFEYRSKSYRLRSEQVEDILHLTSKDPETDMFKSSVIQRMMAAGKTLVLGTISVVTKALDTTKLSILVPPSSLYQSNLSTMQARTYSYFKIRGHNFIFPRFQFSSEEDIRIKLIPFLQSILKQIDSVMSAGEYFVLSPDSLQAFLNSYIEMLSYSTRDWNPIVRKTLKLYAKIYTIFKTKGSIILDEIDMTMDPKKELNFPTLENEPFNMTAATLITDLIEFSVFNPAVQATGLDILGNNQSSLTTENYNKYITLLIKYIKEELKNPKSLWSDKILNIDLKIMTAEKIVNFLSDPDIAFMKDWILELKEMDRLREAEALVIIKVQIWKNLKEVLNSTVNLNYGAAGLNRPDTKYAIPYLAANTPAASSEFADRWETLNKTLLMFASVACTESIAQHMITYLRKNAIRETSLNMPIDETITAKNVATLLSGLRVMELDDQNRSQIKMIHEALMSRSPTAIRLLFSYALDEVFVEMKFPVEQITSNAINMTSMFGSIQGYSGTIDNVNILPREVVAGAYANHMMNEKNNGGISLKLVKDSLKSGKMIHQLSDDILKQPVLEIIKNMIDNTINVNDQKDLSAIIDAGAFFKNFKNRQVAEAILELKLVNKTIKAVLYYDEESNQVVFVQKSGLSYTSGYISSTDPKSIEMATQTKIYNRFTYYDQRHITGSDILQSKTARALMTVGTRVLLRDILQGTLRMRKFMTSQKVHLVTSVAAAKFYFSKSNCHAGDIKVTDILTLGAFNEDEKQIFENERLAFIKIDNEIRRFVQDEITRAILNSTRAKDLIATWFDTSKSSRIKVSSSGSGKNIRDLFIRLIHEDPIEWMDMPLKQDSQIVLSGYANYWMQRIADISPKIALIDSEFNLNDPVTASGKSFEALKNVFKTLTAPSSDPLNKNYESLMAFLEPEITERRSLIDGGNEIEMQVCTQQLVEVDQEGMSQKIEFVPQIKNSEPFDVSILLPLEESSDLSKVPKIQASNLGQILSDAKFSEIHGHLAISAMISKGKRVLVSNDLIELITLPPDSKLPPMIFSKYTWEGSHILVQVLPKNSGIRIVLMSNESALNALNKLSSTSIDFLGSTFWICDLSGQVFYTTDSNTTPGMNVLEFIPLVRILFFDALIFNGSFDQIINNQHLRIIFMDIWLRNEHFKNRAQFLLLRMYVLADKGSIMFAPNNSYFEILRRASRGDKNVLCATELSSGIFKKPPVSEQFEKNFFLKMGKPRPKFEKSALSSEAIDAYAVYTEITKQVSHLKFEIDPKNSINFNLNQKFKYVEKSDNLETEHAVDDQFINHHYPSIDYWKDIKGDSADMNDFFFKINEKSINFNYLMISIISVVVLLLVIAATLFQYYRYKNTILEASTVLDQKESEHDQEYGPLQNCDSKNYYGPGLHSNIKAPDGAEDFNFISSPSPTL